MRTATVFNIQKFSLNDGPGIRTVVFLKGCPLRCAWCSNPESQLRAPQLEWKESACVGCGTCLAAAPRLPRACGPASAMWTCAPFAAIRTRPALPWPPVPPTP